MTKNLDKSFQTTQKNQPNQNEESCKTCEKPLTLCFCAGIKQVKNKIRVVILQHPQEPDKVLGTAKLLQLSLENSELKIGLSWSNLKKIVKDHTQNPAEWAVLYYGSGIKGAAKPTKGIHLVDKKGVSFDPEKLSETLKKLKGLIVIDGSWSQAKALWWRNAWLLKLQRMVFVPEKTSLYGKLRREPKRDCLSTLESVAYTLGTLEKNEALTTSLLDNLTLFLNKLK